MLLFSTVLDIVPTMKPDDFIRLVLEWNETSTHSENRIPDIVWNGEHNIRYGDAKLSLEFVAYPEEDILAARHEKVTDDGVVWDSDFVVHFRERKIAIRLDRTYHEDALMMDAAFSTPHFITLLIEHGYIEDDEDLPVLRLPVFISDHQLAIGQKALSGNGVYRLPVVYVSRNEEGQFPLSIEWLASRLKGAAHVLAEFPDEPCSELRALCDKAEIPYGAVRIFFPSESIKRRNYYYRSHTGDESLRLEKVIRSVIQYGLSQRIDRLYTWQGINAALLDHQLKHQLSSLAAAENARRQAENEVDALYETFDEDLRALQEKVQELTKANEALQYENQGLRAKYAGTTDLPLIYLGDEDEFYPGEIRDMVLSTLDEALSASESATRKADVLEDILDNNPYYHLSEERKQRVKTLFKGYRSLTAAMRQELQSLGFEITEVGKHYKLTYKGDQRYMVTMSKTPSDSRGGSNNAALINRIML